jgi:hypothetical protein
MMQASVPPAPTTSAEGRAVVRYALTGFSDDWIIRWDEVPESAWHDGCLELLKALLDGWVAATARDAAVFRDIAIRARRERPTLGWNPDVCLVEPAPAGASELESMRLWDHAPPSFAFEAVSPNHSYKDYAVVPEKCAVAGVKELCVFDPLLAGPRAQGGPWLLQFWQRTSDGTFERVKAGSDAAWSEVLGAWLVPSRDERRLRIAGSASGEDAWLTREEQARQRESEALRRVAELEAELRRR